MRERPKYVVKRHPQGGYALAVRRLDTTAGYEYEGPFVSPRAAALRAEFLLKGGRPKAGQLVFEL